MGLFEKANEGKPFWDPGVYIAQLISVTESENNPHPEWGTSVLWKYYLAPFPGDPDDQIVDKEGNLTEFGQFTSTKMSPQATARRWAEALLGRRMSDGEDLDLSAILEKYAIVTLIEQKNKEGKPVSKIADIRPYRPEEEAAKPAVRTRKAVAQADREDLPF